MIKILGEHGEIVKEFEANSFVRAFIDIISSCFAMAAQNTATPDITNTAKAMDFSGGATPFQLVSAIGNDALGIIVGTGTAAVTISDYALQTKIAHGTGAGQLSYQAVVFMLPVTSGNARLFRFTRQFFNFTATDITVNELALYGYGRIAAGYTTHCLDRTLSTFTVPASSSRTVEYTLSVTV